MNKSVNYILVVFIFLLLIAPGQARSQNLADLQAQIQQLLETLTSLEARVRATTVSAPTPVAAPALPAYEFHRNLALGSVGEDVRSLQKFLNASGFKVADFGAGSPGSESSYFGTRTRNALVRFQLAHGIFPASGYFGSDMIDKISLLVSESQMKKYVSGLEGLKNGLVNFTIISQGAFRGYEERENVIVRDGGKWREVWNYLHRHLTFVPNPTAVDFSREMVIAVFMGEMPTGGYSVEIQDVEMRNNVLRVKVLEKLPALGQIVSQAQTRPHSIIKVPAFEGEIRFEVKTEMYQLPGLSSEPKPDVIESVEFEPFITQISNHHRKEENFIIRSFEEWKEVWQKIYSHFSVPPDPPYFDFDKNMLVALFFGEKPTTGYSIDVTEIKKVNDVMKISAVKEESGAGCFPVRVVNYPYTIVQLDPFEGEIEFEIQEIENDCR